MAATTDTTDAGGYQEAGIKYVHLGSAEGWQRFLDEFGLSEAALPERDAFAWVAPGIRVVTAANPITGAHPRSVRRPPGYASYVAIAGEEQKVRDVYEYLLAYADGIKSHEWGYCPYIAAHRTPLGTKRSDLQRINR